MDCVVGGCQIVIIIMIIIILINLVIIIITIFVTCTEGYSMPTMEKKKEVTLSARRCSRPDHPQTTRSPKRH